MVAWNFVERTQPHSGAAHATKLRSVSQHAKPHPPNTQKGKEDKETPTGRKEQLGRGEGPTGAPLRRGQLYSGTGGTSGQRPIDGGFDDDDVYYYIRWRLKLEGETFPIKKLRGAIHIPPSIVSSRHFDQGRFLEASCCCSSGRTFCVRLLLALYRQLRWGP